MTWDKPYIDLKLIAGREEDFETLKSLYSNKVEVTEIGNEFVISDDYSANNFASIRVKIMNNGFDPVSIDSQL